MIIKIVYLNVLKYYYEILPGTSTSCGCNAGAWGWRTPIAPGTPTGTGATTGAAGAKIFIKKKNNLIAN